MLLALYHRIDTDLNRASACAVIKTINLKRTTQNGDPTGKIAERVDLLTGTDRTFDAEQLAVLLIWAAYVFVTCFAKPKIASCSHADYSDVR